MTDRPTRHPPSLAHDRSGGTRGPRPWTSPKARLGHGEGKTRVATTVDRTRSVTDSSVAAWEGLRELLARGRSHRPVEYGASVSWMSGGSGAVSVSRIVVRPVLPDGYLPTSDPGPAMASRMICPAISCRSRRATAQRSMARWTRVWGHAQGWESRCARSSDGHGSSLVRAVVSSASSRVAMSAGIRQREWSGMCVFLGKRGSMGWPGRAG